jgi:PAS domain S-box-containing protein
MDMADMCMTEPKVNNKRFAVGVHKMHLLIFAIGMVLVGIVGYGFYSGDRISTVDASLVRSAMKLKLEASTTNLMIEGLLGEGLAADFEPVWAPLDGALQDFRSVVEESRQRRAVLPFRAAAVDATGLANLERKLSAFKKKAAERFSNRRISLLDEEADRVYRQAFKDLVGDLDALENRLRRVMSANLTLFRYSQTAMIVLCIVLTALAAILFQRFAGQRAKAYDVLQVANERLENEIAERRRSEEAVRASEERFRQLAENIMDVFWLEDVSAKNRIVYVSPTFELWSGRKPAEVYADPRIFWQIVHPKDSKRVIRSYREFAGGRDEFDARYRIVRPDGSIRWVRSRGFPIRDAESSVHRVAGLAQDVTDEKRHEERQKQLVKELKDFSNAVSHDLRAPLINLKGFSKEIKASLEIIRPLVHDTLPTLDKTNKKRVIAALYEDLPEAVDFIDASVSKMERLTNAILKLSRLGRRELMFEMLDVNEIVRNTLKSLGHQIKTRGIQLSMGDLPKTMADKVSMEQIFSNLMSNALNYLDPGRIGQIEIDGESRLDENVFHVRDNGCGIKPWDIEKVFNMFERLSNDSIAGEGMGLAYVRALVRCYGGEVFCESEYGAGSKFTFTIPKRIV